MTKQIVVMKQGDGETLNILGMPTKFLCTGENTSQAWSMMEVAIPKHLGPPPHEHPWDEAYYVLHGQVRFTVAGQEQIIKAGEFLYAPGGTVHGFQGDSEDPARMIIVDAPSHTEVFFRELDREIKGPDDRAKIPAIGERNKIVFRSA